MSQTLVNDRKLMQYLFNEGRITQLEVENKNLSASNSTLESAVAKAESENKQLSEALREQNEQSERLKEHLRIAKEALEMADEHILKLTNMHSAKVLHALAKIDSVLLAGNDGESKKGQ